VSTQVAWSSEPKRFSAAQACARIAAAPKVSTVETFRATRIGQCTCCGAIEVVLDKVHGFVDCSVIGESARYPVGYGCELCS
jgi:hypothetical protein